jgi:oxygen-dependent protoporphyrinogen oxidase
VDETWPLGRRRLGQEALDKLIAPMVSASSPAIPKPCAVSCFPRIAELGRNMAG